MKKVTSFTIDDKEYVVLDKVEIDNKTYLYLFNEENPNDFLIQEYQENNNDLQGVSEDIFNQVLIKIKEKHQMK